MWTTWRILALAGIAALLTLCAEAKEVRLALLIGNQDYPAEVGRLSNTHQDARTVQAALNDVGFETVLGTDLDEDGMNDALDAFESHIRRESDAGNEVVAFFYYSGHGAAAYGDRDATNFLIPARENITEVSHIFRKGVKLEEVLDSLQASQAKAIFVVSDACRNELKFSFSKSAGEKGMARVEQRSGMLVAFATAAGETTPDDGLFASVLADEIRRPGQDAALAFYNALADISDRRPLSGRPFMAPGKLPRGLCFAGCARTPVDTDKADWNRLSAINRADAYRIYLDLYPAGQFVESAQSALELFSTPPAPGTAEVADAAFERGQQFLKDKDYTTAKPEFELACSLGDARGCRSLGFLLRNGLGGPKEDDRAFALTERACVGEDARGCNNFGGYFELGLIVDKDEMRARELYNTACEKGDALGCANLARVYQYGIGGSKDEVQARVLYETACNGGSSEGCTYLGKMLFNGVGGQKDYNRAKLAYQKACDDDYAASCSSLGYIYEAGLGVPKNKKRARELYKQACDGGFAVSCGGYGNLLYNGLGGPTDKIGGLIYLRKGCTEGADWACSWLNERGISR